MSFIERSVIFMKDFTVEEGKQIMKTFGFDDHQGFAYLKLKDKFGDTDVIKVAYDCIIQPGGGFAIVLQKVEMGV